MLHSFSCPCQSLITQVHGARLAPGALAELGWRWRHGADVVIKVQNERMQARQLPVYHPPASTSHSLAFWLFHHPFWHELLTITCLGGLVYTVVPRGDLVLNLL